MDVSVISRIISALIILLVAVGPGETENAAILDRDKRMTYNQQNVGDQIFNSFFSLVGSYGTNQNHGQHGGTYHPSGGNNHHSGGNNRPSGGNTRPNGGYNRPNGGNTRPNGGNNRPNNGNVQQPCSPNNQCGKGYGDCETDQDCRRGLFCGKNNCKGEFGSHSPQGIPWERKDDCCTDNSNYCDPADRLPSSRRTCCSPSNPCPFSHGDCDKNADCQSGLMCGDNNCKDFHTGAGNKDDCCTYPENGGNQPNGGNGGNQPNGGNRPNGGNQPNGGLQQCSPNNQCGKGYGDCETNQDCRQGLLCGKNNCKGEFGSHSPQGIPWERKDDCCTDNSNYCDPADRLPSSRRTCCSPSNPCPFSHGDCDKNSDCQSGLMCGDNNCKDFHTGAGNKDDCCTYPENGGNHPGGNGGNQPNGGLQQCSPNNQCGKGYGDCETDQDCQGGLFCGKNNCKGEFGARAPDGSLWDEKDDCCTNNRHYCNQANLFPWWRRTCCSPNTPCPFSHGDCDKDSDCISNLVCGDNNCKDFHANAGDKDDCCAYPDYKKKKRSVEGDEINSLPEDEVSKPFNETIGDEKDRSKRDARFWNNNNGGFSSSNGGFSSSNGGFSSSNGGFSSSSGGYRPSNGGFSSNNGGHRPSNGGFTSNNGGNRPSNGGFSSNNGGNRPSNGGFSSNNGGNRPSNGGFSSNNGGNRPSNGGFSSNNGGFSSNNGGNLPSNGGFSSNNGGNRPSNGGFSSNNGGNRPSNGGFSSNNGGNRPSNGGFSSNNGGNRPSNGGFSSNNGGFTNSNGRPTGGNGPTGGNRPAGGSQLSGCEAEPSFRCCTSQRPCSLGGGDCTGDTDCQQGLVCGSNNCRKFHPNADKKMDCCAFKKIK